MYHVSDEGVDERMISVHDHRRLCRSDVSDSAAAGLPAHSAASSGRVQPEPVPHPWPAQI